MHSTEERQHTEQVLHDNGLCFETFKMKLGEKAHLMTEMEVREVMNMQLQMADVLFDMWI